MFKQILYTQWKWTRLPLLFLALGAFALPFLSAQAVRPSFGGFWDTQRILESIQGLGVFYPALAGALGLMVAMATWAPDHRGRHVYALSLPTPRWHYAMLRFAAGALLLLVPVLALWVASLLASLGTTLPPGVRAYPTMLTIRFDLAALLAYAIFFAISAGTSRTAGYILGIIAAVVVVQIFASLLDVQLRILESALNQIYIWPGPLEIFTGRWMLFDV